MKRLAFGMLFLVGLIVSGEAQENDLRSPEQHVCHGQSAQWKEFDRGHQLFLKRMAPERGFRSTPV